MQVRKKYGGLLIAVVVNISLTFEKPSMPKNKTNLLKQLQIKRGHGSKNLKNSEEFSKKIEKIEIFEEKIEKKNLKIFKIF